MRLFARNGSIAQQFRAQFSSEDVLRRLKNAWMTMRYHHPEIASKAEDDTKVYEIPDALALEAWLQETFVVAADTAKVEDLAASVQSQSLATIQFFPQSCEILFHTSHWRIDETGGVSLLNNFFEAFAKPRQVWRQEHKSFSKSR